MKRFAFRMIWRSALIALAAALPALALYALAQTPLAAQLALAMNVSGPLIALNDLVQGASGNVARARFAFGVMQVLRDMLVLGLVVAVVATGLTAVRGRHRATRRRTRP